MVRESATDKESACEMEKVREREQERQTGGKRELKGGGEGGRLGGASVSAANDKMGPVFTHITAVMFCICA